MTGEPQNAGTGVFASEEVDTFAVCARCYHFRYEHRGRTCWHVVPFDGLVSGLLRVVSLGHACGRCDFREAGQ